MLSYLYVAINTVKNELLYLSEMVEKNENDARRVHNNLKNLVSVSLKLALGHQTDLFMQYCFVV